MSLVSRIAELIATDDTDDSERLASAYQDATPDQRAIVDDCFISLCGYSLATLLEEQAAGHVIYSPSEDGYWSNEDGWGDIATATVFSQEERNTGYLPMSAASDAQWIAQGYSECGCSANSPDDFEHTDTCPMRRPG